MISSDNTSTNYNEQSLNQFQPKIVSSQFLLSIIDEEFKMSDTIKDIFINIIKNIGINFNDSQKTINDFRAELFAKEIDYPKKKCDEFVKFFIFAMSDFNNLSFFLNYFEIDEKFQKTLIQKELLRYNYLKSQNENQYKRSKSSINRNLKIILKCIAYIEEEENIRFRDENLKNKNDDFYEILAKYIDYLIVGYLEFTKITSFSEFIDMFNISESFNIYVREELKKDKEIIIQKIRYFKNIIIYIVDKIIYDFSKNKK